MRPFSPPWVTILTSRVELEGFQGTEEEQRMAGAVELRLDLWEHPPGLPGGAPPSLPELLAPLGGRMPAVITWRRGAKKGRGGGEKPESARRRALRTFLKEASGAAWIDLDRADPLLGEACEMARAAPAGLVAGTRLIASHHAAAPLSDREVEEEASRLMRPGVGALKLVLPGQGLLGIRQALRLGRRPSPLPRALFSAGREGVASRLLGADLGSGWSYGRLLRSRGSDPGQPALALLECRYGAPPWGAREPCFAVIGEDVRRSLSPGFHNRLFARLGRSALFLDLSLRDPEPVLEEDAELTLEGLAVTTPHKEWARRAARPAGPEEAEYPAFNTLRRDPGGDWVGANTDGPAVVALLEEAGVRRGGRVVILGGGGAAQGAAVALGRAGLAAGLLLRDREKARDLRDRAGLEVASEDDIGGADALINATGAGRSEEDPLPWDLHAFRGRAALEMAYEPRETWFLGEAGGRARRGGRLRRIPGWRMFAEQARLQARFLYGVEISAAEARVLTEGALEDLEMDPPPRGR